MGQGLAAAVFSEFTPWCFVWTFFVGKVWLDNHAQNSKIIRVMIIYCCFLINCYILPYFTSPDIISLTSFTINSDKFERRMCHHPVIMKRHDLRGLSWWGSWQASIKKRRVEFKATIDVAINLAPEGQVVCKIMADQWRNCRWVLFASWPEAFTF